MAKSLAESIDRATRTARRLRVALATQAAEQPKGLAEIEFECASMDAARLGIPAPRGPSDLEGIGRVEKACRLAKPAGALRR